MNKIKKASRKTRKNSKWLILVLVCLGVLFAVVIFQMFIPKNTAFPGFKVLGKDMSWKKDVEISQHIQNEFINSKVKFKNSSGDVEYKISDLGFDLSDVDELVEQKMSKSFWERLIPFSWIIGKNSISEVDLVLDQNRLNESIDKIVEKLNKPAKEVAVTLNGNKVVVNKAEDGVEVDKTKLNSQLKDLKFKSVNSEFEVPSNLKKSEHGQISQEMEDRIYFIAEKHIIIQNGSEAYEIPREDLLTYISINYTESKIDLNAEKVKESLNKTPESWSIKPGKTTLIIKDGKEVERKEGEKGKGVDADVMSQKIIESFNSSNSYTYLPVQFKDIPAEVVRQESYTNSQEGLQAYADKITSTKNIRISLKQLDGAGWSVSSRGGESTVSASTYKLFIALRLFEDMKSGSLSWSDSFNGTTVSECFNRMIIASTNPCAEAWIKQYTPNGLTSFLAQKGFSSGTRFSDSDAAHTTTDDLVLYYEKLWNGTLMPSVYRDRLLSGLSSHNYTEGIPSGTSGKVYNKVGFLWDYTHDSGIVVTSRGTYVVAILTKGYSYGTIAQITKELEGIMYP